MLQYCLLKWVGGDQVLSNSVPYFWMYLNSFRSTKESMKLESDEIGMHIFFQLTLYFFMHVHAGINSVARRFLSLLIFTAFRWHELDILLYTSNEFFQNSFVLDWIVLFLIEKEKRKWVRPKLNTLLEWSKRIIWEEWYTKVRCS